VSVFIALLSALCSLSPNTNSLTCIPTHAVLSYIPLHLNLAEFSKQQYDETRELVAQLRQRQKPTPASSFTSSGLAPSPLRSSRSAKFDSVEALDVLAVSAVEKHASGPVKSSTHDGSSADGPIVDDSKLRRLNTQFNDTLEAVKAKIADTFAENGLKYTTEAKIAEIFDTIHDVHRAQLRNFGETTRKALHAAAGIEQSAHEERAKHKIEMQELIQSNTDKIRRMRQQHSKSVDRAITKTREEDAAKLQAALEKQRKELERTLRKEAEQSVQSERNSKLERTIAAMEAQVEVIVKKKDAQVRRYKDFEVKYQKESGRSAALEQQVHGLTQELGSLKDDVRALEKEHQTTIEDMEAYYREKMAEASARHESIEEHMQTLQKKMQKQASRARRKHAQLHSDHEQELTAIHSRIKDVVQRKSQQISELRAQNTILKEKLAKTEEYMQFQQHDLNNLLGSAALKLSHSAHDLREEFEHRLLGPQHEQQCEEHGAAAAAAGNRLTSSNSETSLYEAAQEVAAVAAAAAFQTKGEMLHGGSDEDDAVSEYCGSGDEE
jgi:DNA repair exonuclease SbcCD ATPase subunit